MKKILIAFAVAVAALSTEAQGQPRPVGYRSSQQSRGQMARSSNRGGDRGVRSRRNADDRDKLSSRDQRLIEDIEGANSLSALRRHLQSAVSSRSEAVRMAMVNALENLDKRSAADLAYFIADPSEDVAEAAFLAWTSILSDTRRSQRVQVILESAQILQGQSNGHWQGQGHGAQGTHMAVPGAVQGHGTPMSGPGTAPGYGTPMSGPGAFQGYGAPMSGPGPAQAVK